MSPPSPASGCSTLSLSPYINPPPRQELKPWSHSPSQDSKSMEQQQEQQQKNRGSPSSSPSSGSGRWNPTREQIAILESLYNQGIRTPTAEQIQQITGRLRELGPAEGKNVFYWFQNHKARQRHRLKQDRFAFYTRFLNRGPPITMPMPMPLPTPGPLATANVGRAGGSAGGLHCVRGCNGVCGSYNTPVLQTGGLGLYKAQCQKSNLFIPRPTQMSPIDHQAGQCQRLEPNNINVSTAGPAGDIRTLKLFPLRPTCTTLEAEKSGSSLTSANSMDNCDGNSVEEGVEGSGNNNTSPFFNFFG